MEGCQNSTFVEYAYVVGDCVNTGNRSPVIGVGKDDNVGGTYTTSGFHSGDTNYRSVAELIEELIYTRLLTIVCIIGIFGNVLNLVVLTRKSLTYTMERMEKSAHFGLVGLAVSDTLVCISMLPNTIYGTKTFVAGAYTFRLVYSVYGPAVINTFVLSSTWLTVTMAVGRYLAVCHPLRARQFIGKRFAAWSLVVVFVVCAAFNVPRFFREEIQVLTMPPDKASAVQSPSMPSLPEVADLDAMFSTKTAATAAAATTTTAAAAATYRTTVADAVTIYYPQGGLLRNSPKLFRAYLWTYFAIGIVVPLVTLVYCNAHLSAALRRSIRMRNDSVQSTSRRSERAASRITLTLIAIVIAYVVLFVPAELVNFFSELVIDSSDMTATYNLALAIMNLLQAINFGLNFILYCIVNSHFRRTICRMVGCGGGVSGGRCCFCFPMSYLDRFCPGACCRQIFQAIGIDPDSGSADPPDKMGAVSAVTRIRRSDANGGVVVCENIGELRDVSCRLNRQIVVQRNYSGRKTHSTFV